MKYRRTKLLVTVFGFLGLALSSCQKEEGKGHDNPNHPKPITQPEKPGQVNGPLAVQLLKGTEANDYDTMLVWKVDNEPNRLVLRRFDGDEERKHLLDTTYARGAFVDTDVEPGKSYRYFLGELKDGEVISLSEVSINIPRDLEIRDEWKGEGIIDINRLYLYPGTKIFSNGKKLRIEVNELISDQGKILSMWPKLTAESGQNGKDGGEIILKAKIARGTLSIEGHGQHGGDGPAGRKGRDGKHGQWGKHVKCDYFHRVVVKSHSFTVFYKVYKKGEYVPTKTELQLLYPYATDIRINKVHREYTGNKPSTHYGYSSPGKLGHGKDGENGKSGQAGRNGGNGGNQAKIYVEIEDSSELELNVEKLPGEPGQGGRGGDGGKGGVGGLPGNPPSDCPDHYSASWVKPPKKGKDGKVGAKGRDGQSGLRGTGQPICLKLDGNVTGDCDAFETEDAE